MTGAVDAAARGAIEASERDGGVSPSRFSRYSGRGMGPCGLSRGEGGGGGGATAGISLPYSSELNPAERVLKDVRRWVEGRRYERIEAKRAAVEEVL
jgi:hypothetical protein